MEKPWAQRYSKKKREGDTVMFCEKCGAKLEEGAGFCSNCGQPVNMPAGADQNSFQNQGQQIPPYGGYSGQNPQPFGAAPNGFPNMAAPSGGAPGKPGSKKLPIIAAIAVAVVALVLILINITVVANFLRRSFSSPEEYYRYVEQKKVKELSADAGEMYERFFLRYLDISDRNVSVKAGMKLGEGGQDVVNFLGLTGVDLSWLNSASVQLDTSIQEDALSMGIGLGVNDVDIASGNVVMDMEDGAMYVQVPEINKQYMGAKAYDYSFDDIQEAWEMLEMVEKVYPDRAEAQRLVERYLMTVLSCTDDVSKATEVLKVQGVQQKCTVLTVEVKYDTLADMVLAVLQEARNDKDIERIIKDAAEVAAYSDDIMDPEETYELFLEEIDDEIEEMEEILEDGDFDDETAFEMKVYVNNRGEVVGRSIEIEEEEILVKMLMPEKGRQFGCEFSYQDYYTDPVKLTGSGKRNGDKIDGDFILEYDDVEILEIETAGLNTKDARKGMLNGRINLVLSEDIGTFIYGYEYMPGISMIDGMELTLDCKTGEDSFDCNIGVSLRDKKLVDLVTSYKNAKGSSVVIPGNSDVVMIDDVDDLAEWLSTMELSGLSSSLKKADVPSEVTEALDELDGMDLGSLLRMMW